MDWFMGRCCKAAFIAGNESAISTSNEVKVKIN